VLDAGPLGLLTLPPVKPAALQCERWFQDLIGADVTVVLPEIADFEVRRELIRLDKAVGLDRLDALGKDPGIRYLPISTRAMRLAAQLWADARRAGRPTSDRQALDADVILAAQTRLLADVGQDVIFATTNVRHLGLFVPAAEWWTITADT